VAGLQEIRDRLARMTNLDGDAPVAVVIEHAHRSLATAPSAILTATLDDALAVTERPNMPQTVTEWPNWSIALPLPLEEIESASLARSIAVALHRPGRP
jgi:4-alpha-glucanotransferase